MGFAGVDFTETVPARTSLAGRRGFVLRLPAFLIMLAAVGGCAGAGQTPPWVEVTQIAPYTGAARGPDCDIPVLRRRPMGGYRELAIVEGWSSPKSSDLLLQQLKSKACETGADALVMLEETSQVTKPHLYRPTPNQTSEADSGADAFTEPGAYLHSEEHIPKVGERGHSGYYIDAIAIVYSHPRRGGN